MAKASQLDKAIAALKADRAVLDLAIAKLEAQLTAKPTARQKRKVPSHEPTAFEVIAAGKQ